jgi:NAD-dependent DNA ligase
MMNNINLSTQEYIDFLQRFIILHSYIYYELNGNVISDRKYDEKARELVMYKNKYPELWKTSMYYKQFGNEYNGATGFTLYHDLDEHQKRIIRSLVPKSIR